MTEAQVGTGIVTTVIVCPTPAGGHIEHACDIAIGTFKATGSRALLLTRPGARDYLPTKVREFVEILEVIPPLPKKASGWRRPLQFFSQAANLVREHLRIRAVIKPLSGSSVLLFEEPRYPFPGLLQPKASETKTCLLLHNAIEHSQAKSSLTARIRSQIAAAARNRVNYIAVHGKTQLELVESVTSTPVRSFPLPGSSYLHSLVADEDMLLKRRFPRLAETFVCLGELRANKGLEVAIEASRDSGVRLLIIGKAVDAEYALRIQERTAQITTIEFSPEFITPSDFDYILGNCRAILLPYTQFDAQSGVLARAINKGVPVIASDLASLVEQSASASEVVFFQTGSSVKLADALRKPPLKVSSKMSVHANTSTDELSIAEWNSLADAVQTGW